MESAKLMESRCGEAGRAGKEFLKLQFGASGAFIKILSRPEIRRFIMHENQGATKYIQTFLCINGVTYSVKLD